MWAPVATALVVLGGAVAGGWASPASQKTDAVLGGVAVCLVAPGPVESERTVRVPTRVARMLLERTRSYRGPCFRYGDALPLGDGVVRTFAQIRHGTPLAMGVAFPRRTLSGLPSEPHDGHHCYDVDGDGAIDRHHECIGGHEHVMFLPAALRERVDTPFQWVLMNWNPAGHHPHEAYGRPHFDFHVYIQDLEERNAIEEGPCGLLVDCEDYARGTVPVPDAYRPRDYVDVGAVEAGMGNHLVDLSRPEFNGEPFTHTFIYGAFEGRISFYEPMITLDWFDGLSTGRVASDCFDLKLPTAWARSGWYPTAYCVRYRANRDDYTVSLERFAYRSAS